MDVDVVESRIIRKRFNAIKVPSARFGIFDTSEAFLKWLHEAEDDVRYEMIRDRSCLEAVAISTRILSQLLRTKPAQLT